MPIRDREDLFHYAERNLRDARITFANGTGLDISGIQAVSIEADNSNEMPIASMGAQEATLSLEGINHNMDDAIEEMARQRAEADFQTLEAALRRLAAESQDAVDAIEQAAKIIADRCVTSFMDSLNALWERIGDDFELADEEEYLTTDPISFDELMGGCSSDN